MQARPHPGSAGAVALLGGVFIPCDSQAEAVGLLGVELAEPEGVAEQPSVADELAELDAADRGTKVCRGKPPAWMADRSLLPKKPPR
jgi:hypothetical protein